MPLSRTKGEPSRMTSMPQVGLSRHRIEKTDKNVRIVTSRNRY
jgi:hypothetical protein